MGSLAEPCTCWPQTSCVVEAVLPVMGHTTMTKPSLIHAACAGWAARPVRRAVVSHGLLPLAPRPGLLLQHRALVSRPALT